MERTIKIFLWLLVALIGAVYGGKLCEETRKPPRTLLTDQEIEYHGEILRNWPF